MTATSRLVRLALTIIALAVPAGACDGSDAGTDTAAGESTDTAQRPAGTDRILVLDRLGYPGVGGQIRFFADLAAALG